MDLTAPFKTETLRPLVTLVVPGTIAVGPFVLLLGRYVPPVSQFWTSHASAFTVLLTLSVLAAGFILDDIGSLIESCWDERLNKKTSNAHEQQWNAYLKLQLNDELIGQRYLRNKFTQLKFELSMAPSLITCWVGLLWLQVSSGIWTWCGFAMVSLLMIAGAILFVWASYGTTKLLAKTRSLILEAINEGPKGIAPKSSSPKAGPSVESGE